ncbi:MAG: hypothetical protein DCC53_05155 [Chloroflexi bacterium]|nr:MAG: hypothetical protein DCC53_05155 [Chloroflexota bacterium]
MDRYWALRLVSIVVRALGVVAVIASVFWAVAVASVHVLLAPLALLGGLIGLVVLFAAGQFLLLMIRIEQNTRATAHLLSDRRARREPASVSIHGSWGDG